MASVLLLRHSVRMIAAGMALVLVTVILTVGVQHALNLRPALPPSGRGLPAQEQVLTSWADAVTARDYGAAATFMVDEPLTRGFWQGETEENHQHGWMDEYTITRLEQHGTSTTATLHWTSEYHRDLCLAVQVNERGYITILSAYHWCQDGE